MSAAASRAEEYARLTPEERDEVFAELGEDDLYNLLYDWKFWRREPSQVFPEGKLLTWLLMGGRGSGKTRPGAEEVKERVTSGEWGRVALVGATAADVRDVMVEGESGIKAVSHKAFWPHYEPSKRRVTWPNGAMAFCYSAAEPERLRGPQHHGAWADEIAAWKKGPTAWHLLLMGLRLGENPQVVATTTPKALQWLRRLAKEPTTAVSRMSTYENLANLAPTFASIILSQYEGTRLGAQEIEGILMDDVEGALWSTALIDRSRLVTVTEEGLTIPPLPYERVVVGVDPPGGTITECGIIVAGRHAGAPDPMRKEASVIEDWSLAGTPEVWAKEVVRAYRDFNADAVVAERNFGEEMVRAVIHNVDPSVRVIGVRASDSKQARAQPISILWDNERAHVRDYLPMLETEMTSWVPKGTLNEQGEDVGTDESPNRLDAMVWAMTDLLPPFGVVRGGATVPTGGGAAWRPGGR